MTRLSMGAAKCSTLQVPETEGELWAWWGQEECDQSGHQELHFSPWFLGPGHLVRGSGIASRNRKLWCEHLQSCLQYSSCRYRGARAPGQSRDGVDASLALGMEQLKLPTLGEGAVLPLTCPTVGLGHLDKASPSVSAPLTISPHPFGGNHWLGLWGGLAVLPAHSVFASNPRKSWAPWLGTHSPPPLPFLFFLFLSPLLFPSTPPPPHPTPRAPKVTTCGPKSNPCPRAPAGISPRSPTFLPHSATQPPSSPPPPPFLFVDNFLNAAKLPLSVHRPRKTAAKSQQLCKKFSCKVRPGAVPLAPAIASCLPGSRRSVSPIPINGGETPRYSLPETQSPQRSNLERTP